MSGGAFDYIQYRFEEIAEQIERFALDYDDDCRDEVLARFRIAAETVRNAAKAINRVDWLVSGDDGPESFLRRWAEELEQPT